ncbi:radical SAM protein [Deltaproteobacteria bacterium TL4]
MNVLMIETPSEEFEGSLPFGLLSAATAAFHAGHKVKIVDLVKYSISDDNFIEIVGEFKPQTVGIGGITAGYKRCKELIHLLKAAYPEIIIIVGGVITSVSGLLLKKAGADVVVHGEAEITFPHLLTTLAQGGDIAGVPGISFLKDGSIFRTERRPQVRNLDDIPFPEYSLIKVEDYLDSAENWLNHYFKGTAEYAEMVSKLKGKHLFPIITARGCTDKCSFCYRHLQGVRQHGVEYVVKMMRFLHETYNVSLFQINDELTTAKKKWVMSFCDALIAAPMDIYFIVLSARVDTVDDETLVRLKQAGCVMLNYGYESGSDVILDEMNKRSSKVQNLAAGLRTKNAGIKNVPEIIIGYPSETEETVADTIDFLKKLNVWPISVNTPIPFPETALWDHAVKEGIIGDMEEFVLGYERGRFINFTKMSDQKLKMLAFKTYIDTKLHYLKTHHLEKEYYQTLMNKAARMAFFKLPPSVYAQLRKSKGRVTHQYKQIHTKIVKTRYGHQLKREKLIGGRAQPK